ncbi:MAG: heme-copper oxidase subunit III [Gemmatimonadota bacterium]|jgi:cytochrome c oxidase subunit 3/cytochrome o ubiquinol oxidase subunit 3|nr:heme-copper oxidase subunit III [Gemmatimonadota bacterium]
MAHSTAVHAADPAHLDTSTGVDNRKLAFWTFIGSECLLFGSLIASYMAYKGSSRTGPYPHDTVLADGTLVPGILDVPLTSISTAVLLFSSLFMVLGLAGVQRGDRKSGALWLAATALFGSIFLGFQVYEFTHFWHNGLTLSSNLFGSTFFMLTGFHGAHVLAGVLYMSTLATLVWTGRLGKDKSLNVEIGGLYWHFVDVVWIIIFPLIYLIP